MPSRLKWSAAEWKRGLIELRVRVSAHNRRLAGRRKNLWNRNIPEMVCNYFEDMRDVLAPCKAVLREDGHAVLAVGNSRYDGVLIDVPKILTEIAAQESFTIARTEAVRSMCASAQQGGQHILKESLVWLTG
jgi:hypothetical protein